MNLKNNKYYEYFLLGLKNLLEYKIQFLSSFIRPVLVITIFIILWKYIFIEKGTKLIGGFTYKEMIIYILITQTITILRESHLDYTISHIVKSGDIVVYLSKPINFVKALFFKNLGYKIISFLVFLSLLLLITSLFRLILPKLFIFLIFILYGIFLVIFFTFLDLLIGSLAFYFTEIWGIRTIIYNIIWLASGNVLPLSLFPQGLIYFLKWTPFFYLDYTLASVFLGKYNLEGSLKVLIIFVFWNFLLGIIMIKMYKKGFKNLVTYGG